jgi:hypothetical protein
LMVSSSSTLEQSTYSPETLSAKAARLSFW